MKYIKHPIPEEISDKGGASVQLVQKQTIPLDGAIDAALAAHYCIGQKTAILNNVFGVLKSMSAGIQRDGRPRRIDGFLGLYPTFKGKVDLLKGFDPAENKVQIKARLLNELVLNTKKWSFEDVTPGKKSFTLHSIKAGDEINVYDVSQVGEINGGNLPSTKAGEELRVHWAVEGTDKQGDIAGDKLTSSVSRIDIAAGAITGLTEEDNGKPIVFTVRGNFSSGRIAAKVKAGAAPVPAPTVVITKVKTGSVDGKIVLDEDQFEIVGEHLEKLEGDTLKVKGTSDQGSPVEYDIPYATFACNADGTQLTVQITEAMRDAFYSGWTWDEVTLEYTSHAGVAGSAAQVTTGTAEVVNE